MTTKRKTATTGSKVTRTRRKDTKLTTAQQAAPALDLAGMTDEEIQDESLILLLELKARANAAEAAKQERIDALRAELAELGAPVDKDCHAGPDEREFIERLEGDPYPRLNQLDGWKLRTHDKHYLSSALVVAAALVEDGVIPMDDPDIDVNMTMAAIKISRAMYAAATTRDDQIWMMRVLTASDEAETVEDD